MPRVYLSSRHPPLQESWLKPRFTVLQVPVSLFWLGRWAYFSQYTTHSTLVCIIRNWKEPQGLDLRSMHFSGLSVCYSCMKSFGNPGSGACKSSFLLSRVGSFQRALFIQGLLILPHNVLLTILSLWVPATFLESFPVWFSPWMSVMSNVPALFPL